MVDYPNRGNALMARLWRLLLSAAAAFGLVAISAYAQETTTYSYDALGRLNSSTVSGGTNNGQQTSTSFDPAGNRSNYSVAGAPAASLSIANANVTEGGTAIVTVTRAGSLTGTTTVNYATANGSAVAPGDYASASGTLTFAAGESSKNISITTVDDNSYKDITTFTVSLSSPSAGTGIARATATVNITDNDVVPKLSISDATVVEGTSANLTVTRSGLTSTAVSVNYATANGSAVAPGDYGATSGTLTFQAGETAKTVAVGTVDDSAYEGTENFTVNLSGATGGAFINNAVGTVTLTDNDSPPSFSISNASATEGSNLVLTVSKSGASAIPLSVSYGTSDGTAVAPGDYGAASGTLTFLPGDTTKSIPISTVNDTIYEGSETFRVYLSGATGGAVISNVAGTGTGTILDNDAMPAFSISNASVTEGLVASITITKSGGAGANSSVSYATADGTAGSGQYQTATGVLTFLPWETAKTIAVRTIDNVQYNNSKLFSVSLSSPVNATIATSSATVTILNDDPAPSYTAIISSAVNEGGALRFSAVLSGNLYYEGPLTINYATSSGTATSGVDFTPMSGTFTFNAPDSVQSVLVPTTQDSDYEPDETVNFTISSPSAGTILTSQAVGTITNDDPAPSTGPTANPDNAGNHLRCDEFTINPVANDTDSGGHYPLTLVSVASGTGYTATISGNNVTFFAKGAGTFNILYTVANSIGGQAMGTISYTVSPGPICQ
jgi:YD repeat-containing protein